VTTRTERSTPTGPAIPTIPTQGEADPPASGGIAVRPEIDPEVLAVLAAAVDQAWPRPRMVVVEETDKAPAWRFSGRWWTRPAASRRNRPWA
jgi:hypothetical protein